MGLAFASLVSNRINMLRAPSQVWYAPIKRKRIRNKTINGSTIKIKINNPLKNK